MIEFVYYEEYVIPYQLFSFTLTYLKTLKVKVKELNSVIDATMSSNVESLKTNTSMDKEVATSKIIDTECNKLKCFVLCDRNSSDVNLSVCTALYKSLQLEHSLYEESEDFETNTDQDSTIFTPANSVKLVGKRSSTPLANGKVNDKEIPNGCSENVLNSETLCTNNELEPTLYEQCCDLSDIDECEESSISLSQSCLQQIEKDFAQYKIEGIDVPSKKEKCVKVYTHKRRKSIDELKIKLTDVNNIIQSPPSTNCIDLLDEPSTNDIPVTLLTSLDMESAEYIISLSTENVQPIVGATLTEQKTLNTHKEKTEQIIEYDTQKNGMNKKKANIENIETNYSKPILRRSSRLNQEIEETVNNNVTIKDPSEKHFKRSNTSHRTELCIKKKRKMKDVYRKVPEQAINSAMQSTKKPCNSRRNSTKLIVRKNNKCLVSSKEKDVQTIKIEEKLRCNVPGTTEISSIFTLPKSSTIEHINRALWGDMSDFSEDCQNTINVSEYTQNTEIPFAVGLLPLRTALEKMQATLDYQPRKTRSSVAPIRQDINSLKRKNCTHLSKITDSKRRNTSINDPSENAKAVCHIQIRTAPSQYIRSRKKYLSTDVDTLQASTIMNKH